MQEWVLVQEPFWFQSLKKRLNVIKFSFTWKWWAQAQGQDYTSAKDPFEYKEVGNFSTGVGPQTRSYPFWVLSLWNIINFIWLWWPGVFGKKKKNHFFSNTSTSYFKFKNIFIIMLFKILNNVTLFKLIYIKS